MIRSESEYKEAVGRLADEQKRLTEHRVRLKEASLSDEEIKRVIDPVESFHLQLREEVESYERLKRQEFEELDNLRGLGHRLSHCELRGNLAEGWPGVWTCMNLRCPEMNAMNTSALRWNGLLSPGCAGRSASHKGRNRQSSGNGFRVKTEQASSRRDKGAVEAVGMAEHGAAVLLCQTLPLSGLRIL